MADNNMNKDKSNNQTMQHEQAKASVSGNTERKSEQGGFDKNREQGHEQGREKSAIGGGQSQDGNFDRNQSNERSQTGEAGRARSELGQKSDSDKSREFDKNRSETTSR